jgi:hypothetical protein
MTFLLNCLLKAWVKTLVLLLISEKPLFIRNIFSLKLIVYVLISGMLLPVSFFYLIKCILGLKAFCFLRKEQNKCDFVVSHVRKSCFNIKTSLNNR